jgi:hypothetical protein
MVACPPHDARFQLGQGLRRDPSLRSELYDQRLKMVAGNRKIVAGDRKIVAGNLKIRSGNRKIRSGDWKSLRYLSEWGKLIVIKLAVMAVSKQYCLRQLEIREPGFLVLSFNAAFLPTGLPEPGPKAINFAPFGVLPSHCYLLISVFRVQSSGFNNLEQNLKYEIWKIRPGFFMDFNRPQNILGISDCF